MRYFGESARLEVNTNVRPALLHLRRREGDDPVVREARQELRRRFPAH